MIPAKGSPRQTFHLHATAVEVDGKALVLLGQSGAGKSSVAAQLLVLGASLIADDQVALSCDGENLFAAAPRNAPALIELRGIGLIPVPLRPDVVPVCACVTLDNNTKEDRLPEPQKITLLASKVAHRRLKFAPDLGARLLLWLRSISVP